MSFTEHPRVVQPFIADGIVEAVQTASSVMRQDHIKGAYWTNLHMPPPDAAHDIALRDTFLDAIKFSKEDAEMGRLIAPLRSSLISMPCKQNTDGTLDARLGFADKAGSAIPYLDKQRLATLEALTSMFSHVTLTIHMEHENTSKPHCDSDPKIEKLDPTALFDGRHIRILVPRDMRSTEVYDADYNALQASRHALMGRFKRLPQPWTMAAGNALFLGGTGWGNNKALVHGSPNFKLDDGEHPRTLDVYDCIA